MKKLKEIYNNVLSALKQRLTQTLAGRLGKTEKAERRNDKIIYKKFMEESGKNSNVAWCKVWDSLRHPMTLIPLIGATLSIIIAYLFTKESDTFPRAILQLLTAVLIGFSVNHFSVLFGQLEEKRILMFRAETTVRLLNSIINKVLTDNSIIDTNKSILIEDTLNIIDYWKEYYPKGDTELITKLRELRAKQTNNIIDLQLQKLEDDATASGLSSYVLLSGGTKTFISEAPKFEIPFIEKNKVKAKKKGK